MRLEFQIFKNPPTFCSQLFVFILYFMSFKYRIKKNNKHHLKKKVEEIQLYIYIVSYTETNYFLELQTYGFCMDLLDAL